MSTPINKTNLSNNTFISSETVIWEGPSIPCLSLCTGEKVSSVLFKIGTLVCDLITDLDELKTLTYPTCLEALAQSEGLTNPTTFSLKVLFKLLLDNDCTLKKLIDNIPTTSTSTSVNLDTLNLKCVTQEMLNLCGQIPDHLDVLKVTQAIINILCGIQDDVADILIRLITIESRLTTLGTPGSGGYTEPYIGPVPPGAPVGSVGTSASCLNTGISLLMRDHIPNITDEAVCDLIDLVGTSSDVDDALNAQCLADYIADPDIIQNASNLAQSLKNKEVVICDLIERITSIENTCCNFGCDDIRIGFTQQYNSGTKTYTIGFTYGAGTNIPTIFTDCGSTFIVTDWRGNEYTQPNTAGTLTNGSTFTIDLSTSGLDLSKVLTLQIKTCFTNTLNGLICIDCFGGSLDLSSTSLGSSCWNFIVPFTDELDPTCSNKFINYYSLETTQGLYIASSTNTSNPALVSPIFSTPNNINSTVICGAHTIKIDMSNQSIADPPILTLSITNTNPQLFIAIKGTLNTTCGC